MRWRYWIFNLYLMTKSNIKCIWLFIQGPLHIFLLSCNPMDETSMMLPHLLLLFKGTVRGLTGKSLYAAAISCSGSRRVATTALTAGSVGPTGTEPSSGSGRACNGSHENVFCLAQPAVSAVRTNGLVKSGEETFGILRIQRQRHLTVERTQRTRQHS